MFRMLPILLLVLSSLPATAQENRPPNVILILADDLGHECLGVYGSASYSTPRLDAFAAEGVKFTQCHALPVCTPSRVQLMTGKYNSRNYIAFGAMKPGETTFAHYLKKAGYATCVVGKWQLDGARTSKEPKGMTPEEAGFDDYSLWHYLKRGSRYADPEFKTRDTELQVYKDAYGPDMQSDYALRFIEEHKDAPFFLYYPMTLVHNPFVPTPDSDAWSGDRFAESNDHFASMVHYMDKLVGKLLDKVHALKLEENTIILFTGDNGTYKDVHSRMKDGSVVQGGKASTIETGTHVPLLARWTGHTKPATTYDGLIGFEDFLPTLLELTGITAPADTILDGQSFLPQILGKDGERRDWKYTYYNPHPDERTAVRFARTKRYKLYDTGKYFDTIADPLEKSPLDLAQLDGSSRGTRDKLQSVLDSTP